MLSLANHQRSADITIPTLYLQAPPLPNPSSTFYLFSKPPEKLLPFLDPPRSEGIPHNARFHSPLWSVNRAMTVPTLFFVRVLFVTVWFFFPSPSNFLFFSTADLPPPATIVPVLPERARLPLWSYRTRRSSPIFYRSARNVFLHRFLPRIGHFPPPCPKERFVNFFPFAMSRRILPDSRSTQVLSPPRCPQAANLTRSIRIFHSPVMLGPSGNDTFHGWSPQAFLPCKTTPNNASGIPILVLSSLY